MDFSRFPVFFRVAFRNLWRNKSYGILNIVGLALGMACAALTFLWVENELKYNSSIPNPERVYYVVTNQKYESEWKTFFASPGPLAEALKAKIPEIQKSGRLHRTRILLKAEENIINSEGSYADADILEIFGLDFIEGSAEKALQAPNSIILTQETAANLFGPRSSAYGKYLKTNKKNILKVTGVIRDLPLNSTFTFNWLMPFEYFAKDNKWIETYDNNFVDTFVKLAPSAKISAVEAQVEQILPHLTGADNQHAKLHPSGDWHLRAVFKNGKSVGGAIEYVWLFTFIALIILGIACINFMNLATAKSEKRATEVGIKKILGSNKKNLMFQFFLETILASVAATLLGVVLIFLFLPQFNSLIGRQLTFSPLIPTHFFFVCTMGLSCAFLAGIYPALYLSSLKPIEVFQGMRKSGGKAVAIRKGLVVVQFIFSTVFIIGTLGVYKQIQHVKGRDLGLIKENLIEIPVNGELVINYNPLKQELISSGMVEDTALNSSQIFSSGSNGSGLKWMGGNNTEEILIRFRWITPDFFGTSGINLLEGRNFTGNEGADSNQIIINESFAQLMGGGSALGKVVTADKEYTVIGIAKNFLFGDMFGESQPLMFLFGTHSAEYLYVRIKEKTNHQKALAHIQKTLKKYNPAFPFEYSFVDEIFNSKFKKEVLMGNLSQLFAGIAIVISCLGLFALSAFSAEQRQKEISIRKVLGCSTIQIVLLLLKDFMGLVFMAILIAIPLSYVLLTEWLNRFSYRIVMGYNLFVLAGIISLIIALLTVILQVNRVAHTNPIDNLKS